jgi:hypothetical protein
MTYALRACHVRCSRGSEPALASGSQVAASGDGWLLMAIRGHLGGTPPVSLWSLGYEQPDVCPSCVEGPRE